MFRVADFVGSCHPRWWLSLGQLAYADRDAALDMAALHGEVAGHGARTDLGMAVDLDMIAALAGAADRDRIVGPGMPADPEVIVDFGMVASWPGMRSCAARG